MSEDNTSVGLGQLPVAAFALNQTGKVLAYNEAAAELFGKPEASILGKKGWSILGGRDNPIRDAFMAGEDTEVSVGLGNQRQITLRSKVQTDDEGEVALVVFTAFESQNDSLKGIVEAIDRSEARIEFELDGTILDANENFLNAMGYTLDEIRGKHHSMFVDPTVSAGAEYKNHWARLNRGEFVSGEFARVGKGGKEIWIQASYNPIFDETGTPIRVVKFASDVTSSVFTRREAQEIRSVVDNAPNPTMLLDPVDFRITYANPIAIKTLERLEQYLPIRANEVVGACIDVFHKKPEMQRRLLADPKNLPHTARIEIGPETLQLQIYALYDETGRYKAPALAWNVITDQVLMEKREEAAKQAVKQVQDALTEVARGNVDVHISDDFDEELNQMRDNVNGIAELLRRFNEVMSGLAESARTGDLNQRANAAEFEGAYADIVKGVNATLDAILTPVANIREKLALVATGDLTAYVEDDYEGDHAALKNALNRTLDGLNDLLGQVTSASDQISTSSKQVAAAAQDLSQGASEQAATIEEISAQMGQITAQTTQNAENATQANQLAVTARDGAKSGDERMNQMLDAMREIEEASNNISKIIKVIDEIAFQTNLLALNAAVEAARAGVHGKGFAVVAEEVRNLAARSARAAKETTEMIEGSIKKVSFGTNIAQETATALGAIVSDVGKVTDLVAEIAAASNEQAEGINQVNSGLDQVNQVTQRNTATAEQSAASAEEMSGQTGEMSHMIGKFQLREITGSRALPDGMTPEMMSMLQGYVEQLMGKRSASQLVEPSPDARSSEKNEIQINLDSNDFGKY